jgi:hypothetical protein
MAEKNWENDKPSKLGHHERKIITLALITSF